MNILLFGPQGSGKGTQARLLCERYGFFYFESGAYLRKIAENDDFIRQVMAAGKLVPDKELTSYLTAYLDEQSLYDEVIFDGFPRTVEQYTFLKNWLTAKEFKLDLVLVIEISEGESIRRVSARRQDPKTGKIYNLITEPPPENVDISTLVQRDDDQPESIKRRLGIYRSRTQSLINELKRETTVVEINGERPPEVIHNEIANLVEKMDNTTHG